MDTNEYLALRSKVRQIVLMERQATGLTNQMAGIKKLGDVVENMAVIVEARDRIRGEVQRWKREVARAYRATPVMAWVSQTPGLGDAAVLVLGLAPPLTDFPGPAKLWKYAGLCPGVGPKEGQNHKYSRELKAVAIKRLAESCVRQDGEPYTTKKGVLITPARSPYRDVYDQRRARTRETHPDMLAPGEGCDHCDQAHEQTKAKRATRNLEKERLAPAVECSSLGGVHWSPGHRQSDALRVTAKAILLDMWLVANGKRPRVGPGDR